MLPSGIVISAIFSFFLLRSLPGTYSVNVVTLGSIEIFNNHELFPFKPTVYFHCQGEENKTFLPDVKKTHILFTFNGEESWQPLTELPEEKCKRCGFYEKDTFISDDVFDEWELCPSDFIDGKYFHFKDNEFNATFICPNCTATPDYEKERGHDTATKHNKRNLAFIIIISVLASLIVMAGMVVAYKYWQKRKRDQDQARFLKLFEEGDDIEDELDLDLMIGYVCTTQKVKYVDMYMLLSLFVMSLAPYLNPLMAISSQLHRPNFIAYQQWSREK